MEFTEYSELNEFFVYFEKQWFIERNYGWFESHANCFPSTNNGLETKNGLTKKENTLHVSKPMGKFLDKCFMKILADLNCKDF